MKIDVRKELALAKGQIWQTKVADFEIMALNQDFIHYTVRKRLGQKRVSAQISGLAAMANYLRANQALLAKVPGEKISHRPVTSRLGSPSRLAQ